VREVELGRALRVRRHGRLAAAGVAPADELGIRFGGGFDDGLHRDDLGIDARELAGAHGHEAAQTRRQREGRVEAQQRAVAELADRLDERRVVERPFTLARRDLDDRRGGGVHAQRGEGGLLALAASEVHADDVVERARFHAFVSVRDSRGAVNLDGRSCGDARATV